MRRSWSPHAGAPAVPAAFAVAAGILAGRSLPLAPPLPLGLALVAVSLFTILVGVFVTSASSDSSAFSAFSGLRVGRGVLALGALILAAAAGFHGGRYRLVLPARGNLAVAQALGQEALVEVVGRISAPWSASGALKRTELRVERARRAGSPQAGSQSGRDLPLSGRIGLSVSGQMDPRAYADVGDEVRARGPLRLPDFAAWGRSPVSPPPEIRIAVKSAAQLERLDGPVGALAPVHVLHRLTRQRLAANLSGGSPAEARTQALLEALILGETADLPDSMASAFRDGGVAHVLSISGFHVGLFAALLGAFVRWAGLSVARRDAAVLLGTLLFAAFCGGRPPVVRAALMIGLYLTARLLGRPTSPGQVVGFAAVVLLLAEPANLFDVGFLLTFSAVFGLAAFGVPAGRGLSALGVRPRLLAEATGATLGAELAVFPVQTYVFGIVPFVALLSNLVVVPLVALFLLAGLCLAPLLLLSAATAHVALVPLRLLADGLLGILYALDNLGAFRLVPTPPFVLVLGLAGLLLVAAWPRMEGARRPALFTALFLVVSILVRPSEAAPAGAVRLQCLDVGQGDSWLLISETGRVLVDGGGSLDGSYDFGRHRLLPKLAGLGAVSFDAVVLTHPHPDHAGGLMAVLSLAPVGRLVLPRGAPRNAFLEGVLQAASRRDIPVFRVGAGERFEAAGLLFEVLHPGGETYPRAKENNGSLVFMSRLGERTALFTGDVEAMAERDLLGRSTALAADLLKVAHHGSRTSTTPEFVAAVAPRVAFIGVGRRNHFGHPNPEVLARLLGAGARVYRTDRDGDLGFLIRGRRILPQFPEPFPSPGGLP